MTCPNGHQVRAGSKFCPECGAAVQETPPTPAPSKSPSRERWRRPIILIPAAVIAFLVALGAIGAIVGAVTGGGDSGTSAVISSSERTSIPPTKPNPRPKVQPLTWLTARRYQQLLKPHMTVVSASKVLCVPLGQAVSTWKDEAETLSSSLPGADVDSYGAADFVSWYDGHPDVERPGRSGLQVEQMQSTEPVEHDCIRAGRRGFDVVRLRVEEPLHLFRGGS